jgi:cytochrome c oxidase cbb3-type subunit 2
MFHWIERRPFFFALSVFAVITVGGIVEIIPSFRESSRPIQGLKPYTALQMAGRQIYIKEGCNGCHSQLIRPFKAETDRYGAYSKSGEYAYDRPFLWGSRRTGPDLLRVGNTRTTSWHEAHFRKAASVSLGTVMPNFPWFFKENTDIKTVYAELLTLKKVFKVPYDKPGMPKLGEFKDMKKQMIEDAKLIAKDLRSSPNVVKALEKGEIKEIIAIIAYLNRLK